MNGFYKTRFPQINSKSESLDNKIIIKLINDQLRQFICFSENKPAVFRVANFLSVFPALCNPVNKKLFVDLIFFISCQQSDQYLRFWVNISLAHKFSVIKKNFNYIAGFYTIIHFFNFIGKYPGVSISNTI